MTFGEGPHPAGRQDDEQRTGPLPVVPPPSPLPAAPGPGRRRWAGIVAWVLVGVLTAAVAGVGYLYSSANGSAASWRALADASAAELSSTHAQLDETIDALAGTKQRLDATTSSLEQARTALAETKGNLDQVTGEFNDVSDRIRSLANEKARAGDQIGLLDDQIGRLATALAQAGEVSAQLGACVGGLQDLQDYLRNASDYDNDSLVAYADDINNTCAEAQATNEAFQAWLAGL